jgi:DNA polymerase III sliding clamp (beta) subunit (PCNA family)
MDRSELVKTLNLVRPALASANLIPIFQCFNFNKTNRTVSGYNDTIAIVGPCDFPHSGSIHGPTLLGILENSNTEEADFKFTENTVTLKLGKTISKLPYLTEDSFIFEQPTEQWVSGVKITGSFIDALKICLETVSSDTTQPALGGISLVGNNLYSCNGDSITRVVTKNGIKGRVLMPTAFCSAVLKLWEALSLTKGELHFNNTWVFADFGEWSIYGNVLEIKDPIDFEKLIKDTVRRPSNTQAVPAEFSEALQRARVLSDPESQKTVVTISKGKMHLFTETYMGDVSDTMPCGNHPDVVANINAGHVFKAMQFAEELAFYDNCIVLTKAPNILLLVSNMN